MLTRWLNYRTPGAPMPQFWAGMYGGVLIGVCLGTVLTCFHFGIGMFAP